MSDTSKNRLNVPASRRTIVSTGAKLAYAAPIVAASFKLSAFSAQAQTASPGVVVGSCPAAGCPAGQKCCRTESGMSACCPDTAFCCAGSYSDGTEYLGCGGTCANAPYAGCRGCQPVSPTPGICCPDGTPPTSPGTCFCAGKGFACGAACNCTRGGACPYCCSGVCGSDGRCL